MTSTMLTAVRDLADYSQEALLRVYELILSWPCPHCGGAFPCPCDKARALQLQNECANIESTTQTAPGLAGLGAAEPVR